MWIVVTRNYKEEWAQTIICPQSKLDNSTATMKTELKAMNSKINYAKKQISDPENKITKITQSEQQTERKMKKQKRKQHMRSIGSIHNRNPRRRRKRKGDRKCI